MIVMIMTVAMMTIIIIMMMMIAMVIILLIIVMRIVAMKGTILFCLLLFSLLSQFIHCSANKQALWHGCNTRITGNTCQPMMRRDNWAVSFDKVEITFRGFPTWMVYLKQSRDTPLWSGTLDLLIKYWLKPLTLDVLFHTIPHTPGKFALLCLDTFWEEVRVWFSSSVYT